MRGALIWGACSAHPPHGHRQSGVPTGLPVLLSCYCCALARLLAHSRRANALV